MLSFVLLALTPVLLHAQQHQQIPLQEHQPEVVIPLTVWTTRLLCLAVY